MSITSIRRTATLAVAVTATLFIGAQAGGYISAALGASSNLSGPAASAVQRSAELPPIKLKTEFTVPGDSPYPGAITKGPDGNLWFTLAVAGEIGRITPSGSVTEFPASKNTSPQVIVSGPDGNMWYAADDPNYIGKITTSGSVAEVKINWPKDAEGHTSIAFAHDGSLWFTAGQQIGKMTRTGWVSWLAVPLVQTGNCAHATSAGLAIGPDNSVWFTVGISGLNGKDFGCPEATEPVPGSNVIGRISPSGKIVTYRIPTSHSDPTEIVAGPDGNMWFIEKDGNRIGKITPSGNITEYLIPTAQSYAESIAVGPDGNMWFTEGVGNNIGRITRSGNITESQLRDVFFMGGNVGMMPSGITAGPDGNMWFTEIGRIGEIDLSIGTPTQAAAQATPSPAPDWYRASFSNNVYANETLGFSVTIPQGWRHQEADPNSVTMAPVHTLLRAGPSDDVFLTIEAREDSENHSPGLCGDLVVDKNDKIITRAGKPTHVNYGGKDFAQMDVGFQYAGRPKNARVLQTCEPHVYLRFTLIGNTGADVDELTQVLKSLQFSGS